MAKDLGDVIGHAVGRVARETVDTLSSNAHKASSKAAKSPLAGPKGLAAGAGLVALAPLAAKGASKVVKGRMPSMAAAPVKNMAAAPVKKVKEAASDTVKSAVDKKVEESGGVGGIAKEGVKSMIPGMGNKDKDDKPKGADAIGKGRKMPIQQAVDVAVPISTAYNQWTQYEEWPKFMHRLISVSQEDDTHVSFKTKIFGISREFKAEIEEQRPDERIKWKVTEGVTHSGVVTFHKLADRLTRVDVDLFVEPSGMIEKAGRGMRHAKRAVRADLARFKAYVEFQEEETGAWRKAVEDGDVKSTSRSASSRSRSRAASGGRSGSSSSDRSGSSSGGRSGSGSSSSRSKAASSGGRSKSASSGGRSKSPSSGGRSKSASSGGGSSRSGSNGRSASSGGSSGRSSGGSRASSSRSSRASSSNGRTGSRSGSKQTTGSRS
jgi:uncharacterized membrane protein